MGKEEGIEVPKSMDSEDLRTPRSRYFQINTRMENLSNEIVEEKLEFEDSMLEEDESARDISLVQVAYNNETDKDMIATGKVTVFRTDK